VLKERRIKNKCSKLSSPFLFIAPTEGYRNIKHTVALFPRIAEVRERESGMFRTPVALVGLAGVFFVAGSFAPDILSMSPLAQSDTLRPAMAASTKGDRVAGPVRIGNPTSVSIVEVVGVTDAAVILRDRDGQVLYKSDPRTGVTTFARNTELPVLTLKEGLQSRPSQHLAIRREGNEAPQQKQKTRNPVGCMGDVSPLAKASVNRMPSLCLASLDRSMS
jgi:hypothetical protein